MARTKTSAAAPNGMQLQSTATSGVDPATIEAIRNLFGQAKALYAPGGDYMKGAEAGLERGRTKAIAGGMQGLASAGLANTSMMGGLAKQYEEEVAAPTRASATSGRLSALSGLMGQEAGAMASTAPTSSSSYGIPQTFYGPTTPAFPEAAPTAVPRQTSAGVNAANQPAKKEPGLSGVNYYQSAGAAPSFSASEKYLGNTVVRGKAAPSLAKTFSPKGVGLYGPTPTGGNVQAAKATSPIMAALNKIGFSYW